MKGLLIYDAAGKARNEWFIERLIEAAEKRGHGLELVIYSDESNIPPLKDYDFAIVRAIAPNLNEMLETAGIPSLTMQKPHAQQTTNGRPIYLPRSLA